MSLPGCHFVPSWPTNILTWSTRWWWSMAGGPQHWSPACAPSSSFHPASFTACRHVWLGASSSKINLVSEEHSQHSGPQIALRPFPLTHLVPFLTSRAGFARQGAKEKQLLKQGNAFNVSPFVLRAMMSGQYWPEGDEVYHAELTVPILLIHGMCDKFVPVDEDQRMAEVQRVLPLCMWHLGFSCCANRRHCLSVDPPVCLPESDWGGESHGHDGVSWHRQHSPPWILSMGAWHVQKRRQQYRHGEFCCPQWPCPPRQ